MKLQVSLLALVVSTTFALTCTKAPAVAYPIGVSISLQAIDLSSCTDKDRTKIGKVFNRELKHLLRKTSSLGDVEIALAICTDDEGDRNLRGLILQGYSYYGSGGCFYCGEDNGDRRLVGDGMIDEAILDENQIIDVQDDLSDRLTEQVQKFASCLDGQDPTVLVTVTNTASFDENECGDV